EPAQEKCPITPPPETGSKAASTSHTPLTLSCVEHTRYNHFYIQQRVSTLAQVITRRAKTPTSLEFGHLLDACFQ
ncbi:hypothetical protein SK128_018885, partial [Halocaridina rubra]